MEYLFLIVAIFALLSHALAALSVLREVRRAPKQMDGSSFPRVSILKPLCGVDDQLERNIESYFRLDYPRFELVFCAADPEDQALEVAREDRARHPEVACRYVVGESPPRHPPKVKVLAHATRFARGEMLLVSDSNVRVEPDYLKDTVAEMDDPEVAVVSNLVVGVEERSLGAALENLQLNGFIAPAICLGLTLRALPCVVGKSMLLRRSDLEAVGGWKALSDVLAEDYVLGKELAKRKRRAVVCAHSVETVNEHWSLGRFLERHDRWLKMRWRINPAALFFEIAANVTFWTLLWVAFAGVTPWVLAGAASLIVGRVAIEGAECRALRKGLGMPWFVLPLVPVRDIVLALLWIHARFSRKVRWREGQTLLLGRHSTLSLPASAPAEVILPESSAEPASVARR